MLMKFIMRFVLQIINIPKKKLQLLGVGAMFLATKYEEMHVPEILDFVYITDNSFSASQIRQMEVLILKKLEFNIGMPTAPLFLRRLLKVIRQLDMLNTVLAEVAQNVLLGTFIFLQYHCSQAFASRWQSDNFNKNFYILGKGA